MDETYETRRDRFARERERWTARSRRLSWARFAVAAVVLGALFGVLFESGTAQLGWLAAAGLGIGVFLVLVALHDRVIREERRLGSLVELNTEALARRARRWDGFPVPRPAALPGVDGPLARDLKLFGRASLFHLLGTVATPPGRTRLTRWLLHPAPGAEARARQRAVRFLAPELDWRQELTRRARELAGEDTESEPLLEWAEGEPWLVRHPALLWGSRIWVGVSLALMAAAVAVPAVPAAVALVVFLANVGLTYLTGDRTEPTFDRVEARERKFHHYSKVFALFAERGVPRGAEEGVGGESEAGLRAGAGGEDGVEAGGRAGDGAPAERVRAGSSISGADAGDPSSGAYLRLARLAAVLAPRDDADGTSPHLAMETLHRRVVLADSRHSGLLHFFLAGLFLWDLHVLVLLERWQVEHGRRVRGWLDALGEIEALSALAGLAFDQPEWALPELVEETAEPAVEASELGHPLLADGVRVGNDVGLGPPGSFLLVTGSNMSGKSTLLRSIGTNVVLAQAGGPVAARAMRLPPLALGTSVLVEDSLEDGVSFFLAEILRLSEIVAAAREAPEEGRTLLFLLDEVLRGTNSHERRIAVEEILTHLLEAGAIGAVSTHDFALAESRRLARAAHLVHFRETISPEAGPEGESSAPMTFDYRLREGLSPGGNALKLLELVGLRGTAPVERTLRQPPS